jgi:hypothetical protein
VYRCASFLPCVLRFTADMMRRKKKTFKLCNAIVRSKEICRPDWICLISSETRRRLLGTVRTAGGVRVSDESKVRPAQKAELIRAPNDRQEKRGMDMKIQYSKSRITKDVTTMILFPSSSTTLSLRFFNLKQPNARIDLMAAKLEPR